MLSIVLNDPQSSELMFSKITPDVFKTIIKDIGILSIDIKTTGLDPIEDDIKAVTVATKEDNIYVLTTEVISSSFLAEVFNNKTLIVHSGSKDISFLMAHGVEIKDVCDTCLEDQVCNADVDGSKLSYSLPSVLDRYGIAHTFKFYENGSFWSHGFDVCGCNYLSLYVRHLFELRSAIYRKHPQSANLFLMVNNLLMISSQLNVTPLKLNRNLLVEYTSDFLNKILEMEENMLDTFAIANDSPGKIRDELFLPHDADKITPLYDIDNDDVVRDFIERCEYSPIIENAIEVGELDFFPNEYCFDEYKKAIRQYNDVYTKLLAQKDENVFSHYSPITQKSLSIGCIKNFPRPAMAKRNNISLMQSLTINPLSIIKDNIFNTDEYEMRAYEILDIEIYGLAILSSDTNLHNFITNQDEEVATLLLMLKEKGISDVSQKTLISFVREFFKNGCKITDKFIIKGFTNKKQCHDIAAILTSRYHYAINTFVGIIKRLQQSGNALIFGDYPLTWRDYEWYNETKAKLTEEFWETYQIHQEIQDDTWAMVTRFYQEEQRLQKVVADRIIDYSRLFVMNAVMSSFLKCINQKGYDSIISFVYADKSSFVLYYPLILSEDVDKIEDKVVNDLNHRLGSSLPLTSMII